MTRAVFPEAATGGALGAARIGASPAGRRAGRIPGSRAR
jgi:hypothetical protein